MNRESKLPEPLDELAMPFSAPLPDDEEPAFDEPASPSHPRRREVRAFDEHDEAWISTLLDVVERSLDEPWRVLEERLERARLASSHDVRSILIALKRVVGGRTERIRVARTLRERILGVPALDASEREARIAAAADALGIAAEDVESMLWADLSRERPVALPRGRPQPLQLAALANLDRVQAAVRRAQEVRIELRDDANELIRTAARYGLLASARHCETTTILQVAGPLALFHATAVYGRALAALVPLLSDHAWLSFEIVEPVREPHQPPRSVYLLPPLLLPPVPVTKRRKPTVGQRLARQLLDAGFEIQREPPPIARGEELLFPELAVIDAATGQRWLVEIVGFSTDEYLAHRLASYDASHDRNVLLCVDAERSPHVAAGGRARIVPFRRHVELDALVAAMRARGGV